MEAEVIVLRKNQLVEETMLLEEIQRSNIREQKVLKELKKDNRQAITNKLLTSCDTWT